MNNKRLLYFIVFICLAIVMIGVGIGYHLSSNNRNTYEKKLGDITCQPGQYISNNECVDCPSPYNNSSGTGDINSCTASVPAGHKLDFIDGVGIISVCPDEYYSNGCEEVHYSSSYQCLWCAGQVNSDKTECSFDYHPHYCFANSDTIENATEATWSTEPSETLTYQLNDVSEDQCIASACYGNGTTFANSTIANWYRNDQVPSGYNKFNVSKNECYKEEPACYKTSNNTYYWGTKQNSSDTLVPNVTSSTNCVAPEEPACYKTSNNTYYWGTKQNSSDTLVPNVTSSTNCVAPEEPACYKTSNNTYYWGTKQNSSDTLIDNITDINECVISPGGEEIPEDHIIDVPKTAADVQTIVYVGTTVLIVFGLVFMYFATNNKKD